MRADITAIIVAYNSAKVLAACLEALSLQDVQAIVVNNASQDESVAVAIKCGAKVIQSGKNLGYGRANNIGVRAAETPYILVINPDVMVQPGAIDALVLAANNDPDHALFSPKIIEPDGRVFDTRLGPLGPFASGACFLMRRDVFLDIGGFDENIFLFYEDDDLCRRLSDRGQPPVYVDQAVVRHDRGKSTGDHEMNTPRSVRVKGEFTRRYHQAWSRFYVLKKFNASPSALKWGGFYGMKYIFAFLTLNPVRRARYAGSFWGAVDKKRRFG